ncbi:hypothetical protein ABW20_dc0109336 [Dactylellina cionopaga]|nr:hypothetical protein ABW20_dc0109336 [Dactylellina cionopaga]
MEFRLILLCLLISGYYATVFSLMPLWHQFFQLLAHLITYAFDILSILPPLFLINLFLNDQQRLGELERASLAFAGEVPAIMGGYAFDLCAGLVNDEPATPGSIRCLRVGGVSISIGDPKGPQVQGVPVADALPAPAAADDVPADSTVPPSERISAAASVAKTITISAETPTPTPTARASGAPPLKRARLGASPPITVDTPCRVRGGEAAHVTPKKPTYTQSSNYTGVENRRTVGNELPTTPITLADLVLDSLPEPPTAGIKQRYASEAATGYFANGNITQLRPPPGFESFQPGKGISTIGVFPKTPSPAPIRYKSPSPLFYSTPYATSVAGRYNGSSRLNSLLRSNELLPGPTPVRAGDFTEFGDKMEQLFADEENTSKKKFRIKKRIDKQSLFTTPIRSTRYL